jgi:AraC family transcriptional regulator
MPPESPDDPSSPESDAGLSQPTLAQALAYIEQHLDQSLSLEEIAADLNLSVYHFGRLFKQSTGQSPYQYVLQQRVERAKQLLMQPDLSITEVAIACGFSHAAHLAKHFRQHTGLTPTQFRQQ